jgi:hypothetical protein
MISTTERVVQPAADTENPFPATDPACPVLRAEYAIQTPLGTWWRKLAEAFAEPYGLEPTVFYSRAAALRELADVIAVAEHIYGAADYRPELMSRAVRIGTTPATTVVGPWHLEDWGDLEVMTR